MAFSDYCSPTCGCDDPCRTAREAELQSWRDRGVEPTANERRAVEAADYGDASGCGGGSALGALITNFREHAEDIRASKLAADVAAERRGALDALAMHDGEERVVDPKTGGVKGRKLARFDLLPADALAATAEHFGRGARKYADRNWEKSYAWSLSFGAMQRHAWAYWGGEDVDAETGSLHLAAVAFHALALLAFQLRGIGTDDRAIEAAQ